MQQDYVCLNTEKNLKETEQIVQDLGMEVILKIDTAYMDFNDLTNEEKVAWADSLEMQVNRAVEDYDASEKTFHEVSIMSKRYAEEASELIKSYRKNRDFDIVGAIDKLNKKREKAVTDHYYDIRMAGYGLRSMPLLHVYNKVSCSVLVARKGENVLRYVGILDNNDPIVTITGPNAQSLLIGWKGTSYSTKNVSYHSS